MQHSSRTKVNAKARESLKQAMRRDALAASKQKLLFLLLSANSQKHKQRPIKKVCLKSKVKIVVALESEQSALL